MSDIVSLFFFRWLALVKPTSSPTQPFLLLYACLTVISTIYCSCISLILSKSLYLFFVTLCVSFSICVFPLHAYFYFSLFHVHESCLLTLPCCQNPKCILKSTEKECCSLYLSMLNAIGHYSF